METITSEQPTVPPPDQTPNPDEPVVPRRSPLRAAIKTGRPKEWIKNVFVFAGLLFSGHFTNGHDIFLAVVTFVPLTVSAAASIFFGRPLPVLGLIGSVLSMATIFCTAMLYASLRSVEAWATWRTPLCYLLFALAGGCVAASFLAFCGAGMSSFFAPAAVILLAAAWTARRFWRRRMLDMRPLSTPESATGLSAIGRVRQFERPHMTENYLTREMGFKVARKHAGKLWRLALLVGAVVPVVLLFFLLIGSAQPGWPAALVAGVAALASLLGIVVERWLFFAEARHAVMNYYGG